MPLDDRYAQLLAHRVPRDETVLGRAYVIHARNGGVGIAVEERGQLGYRLHRKKFGEHCLFVEYDWDNGPPHGTAIPLRALAADPPIDEDALLAWLAEQEAEHAAEVEAAWDVVLGRKPTSR